MLPSITSAMPRKPFPFVLFLFLLIVLIPLRSTAQSHWSYAPSSNTSDQVLSVAARFDILFDDTINGIEIIIANNTDFLITIMWDESALVLPNGTSERVIHTGVRIFHKALPQAPTPIPPHTRTTEVIWPVSHVTESGLLSSIPISDKCSIRLYLTVKDAVGEHVESWTWIFNEGTKAPSVSTVFGLSFPCWGRIHYDARGNLKKITGLNLGLGYSVRHYTPVSGLRPKRFNTYWGWGTIALVIPYVEVGVSYPIEIAGGPTYLVLDLGLFYILPWIGISIYF